MIFYHALYFTYDEAVIFLSEIVMCIMKKILTDFNFYCYGDRDRFLLKYSRQIKRVNLRVN